MTRTDDISRFWSENPMTYGSAHGEARYDDGAYQPGTRAFFERVDREFLAWNRPLHGDYPFDRLFPYGAVPTGGRVLELGCGMGTMAALWATRGADVVAVDLNEVAVAQTRRRFELMGLTGQIEQADARDLPFAAGTFDYVWSWGVLHHSPDIERSIAELMRVLKPGGGFGVMVYHRRSLLHLYMTRYVEGFLHRETRFLDSLGIASRYGDAAREEGNPHTWPMTRSELKALFGPHSEDLRVRTLGTDLDGVLPWMVPGLGSVLPVPLKKPWARRFGWSLWSEGHRRC